MDNWQRRPVTEETERSQCSRLPRLVTMRGLVFALLLFGISVSLASSQRNDGVLDKIKAGLQYATNYLETAKDIADLVSKSLGQKRKVEAESGSGEAKRKPEESFGTSNLVTAFFRLLGLDSQKVAAIAVNSVVFLAQMIGSMFNLKPPTETIGRSLEDEDQEVTWDPVKYIMENKNERIQGLLGQARDRKLPSQLIDHVDGLDTGCVRLFLCKTSPIIRAAQDSLVNGSRPGFDRMTSWMPSRDEFEENGERCEDEHPDCNLFPE